MLDSSIAFGTLRGQMFDCYPCAMVSPGSYARIDDLATSASLSVVPNGALAGVDDAAHVGALQPGTT